MRKLLGRRLTVSVLGLVFLVDGVGALEVKDVASAAANTGDGSVGTPKPSPEQSKSPPLANSNLTRDPVAETLLKRMQVRYQAPQSLKLRFEETYTNHATGRKMTDRGNLIARRPGEMRWEYVEPVEKLFVMSGDEAWFYVPDEMTAYRMATDGDSSRRIPILFLAGKGDLTELFVPAVESTNATTRLRLRSRHGEDELENLVLELDPESAAVRSLSVVDVLGNITEFSFSDERLNEAVESRLFRFIPPSDVDIVEQDR